MFRILILAGGKGTRLRSVLGEALPKPLAPVQGRPFLEILLKSLEGYGNVYLSIGYRADAFSYLNNRVTPILEEEPLGTGGAIAHALSLYPGNQPWLILNGDTFFPIDISEFYQKSLKSDVCIAATYQHDTSRYGRLEISPEGHLLAFHEKQAGSSGWINAGIYAVRPDLFSMACPLSNAFSFEDFIQSHTSEFQITVECIDAPFIDIGIPEDYERAQTFSFD